MGTTAEIIDSGGTQICFDALLGRGLPGNHTLPGTDIEHYFHAVSNFVRTFDFSLGESLVLLTDKLLDPRVVSAITGLAAARGIKPVTVTLPTTNVLAIPEDVKPILSKATFVVSTWYCSVMDPYCISLRRDKGQRWVKITFFRDLDLLKTPQARFPTELVGEIVRATARRFPRNVDCELRFTDSRGSDLRIPLTADMVDRTLESNRWRGETLATNPGSYVHYLPTHGPNLFDPLFINPEPGRIFKSHGILYAQWAVGFLQPFREKIGVRFQDNRVVEVLGASTDAVTLREMLIGGELIELGCGFNPKWPRHLIYPAGSNSPGALHYGIDLTQPADYIKRALPNWEEPPIHVDLVSFDATVDANEQRLVTGGFLEALRDEEVIALAAQYGEPVDLLQNWPV